jgi:hypothetical protein
MRWHGGAGFKPGSKPALLRHTLVRYSQPRGLHLLRRGGLETRLETRHSLNLNLWAT